MMFIIIRYNSTNYYNVYVSLVRLSFMNLYVSLICHKLQSWKLSLNPRPLIDNQKVFLHDPCLMALSGMTTAVLS